MVLIVQGLQAGGGLPPSSLTLQLPAPPRSPSYQIRGSTHPQDDNQAVVSTAHPHEESPCATVMEAPFPRGPLGDPGYRDAAQ
jgi:hypothetical protein